MSSRVSFAPAILGKAVALAVSVLRPQSSRPAEILPTPKKLVASTSTGPHAHPSGISINHLPGPAELLDPNADETE